MLLTLLSMLSRSASESVTASASVSLSSSSSARATRSISSSSSATRSPSSPSATLSAAATRSASPAPKPPRPPAPFPVGAIIFLSIFGALVLHCVTTSFGAILRAVTFLEYYACWAGSMPALLGRTVGTGMFSFLFHTVALPLLGAAVFIVSSFRSALHRTSQHAAIVTIGVCSQGRIPGPLHRPLRPPLGFDRDGVKGVAFAPGYPLPWWSETAVGNMQCEKCVSKFESDFGYDKEGFQTYEKCAPRPIARCLHLSGFLLFALSFQSGAQILIVMFIISPVGALLISVSSFVVHIIMGFAQSSSLLIKWRSHPYSVGAAAIERLGVRAGAAAVDALTFAAVLGPVLLIEWLVYGLWRRRLRPSPLAVMWLKSLAQGAESPPPLWNPREPTPSRRGMVLSAPVDHAGSASAVTVVETPNPIAVAAVNSWRAGEAVGRQESFAGQSRFYSPPPSSAGAPKESCARCETSAVPCRPFCTSGHTVCAQCEAKLLQDIAARVRKLSAYGSSTPSSALSCSLATGAAAGCEILLFDDVPFERLDARDAATLDAARRLRVSSAMGVFASDARVFACENAHCTGLRPAIFQGMVCEPLGPCNVCHDKPAADPEIADKANLNINAGAAASAGGGAKAAAGVDPKETADHGEPTTVAIGDDKAVPALDDAIVPPAQSVAAIPPPAVEEPLSQQPEQSVQVLEVLEVVPRLWPSTFQWAGELPFRLPNALLSWAEGPAVDSGER